MKLNLNLKGQSRPHKVLGSAYITLAHPLPPVHEQNRIIHPQQTAASTT